MCAKNVNSVPAKPQPKARLRPALGLLWLGLVAVPVLAGTRLVSGTVAWVVLGAIGAMSLVSLLLYHADKRRAETAEWRIPEATLHLVDFFGGWPGGFWGQRWFRHKTAKMSFQAVYWLTIVGYELLALDIIFHGYFHQRVMSWITG